MVLPLWYQCSEIGTPFPKPYFYRINIIVAFKHNHGVVCGSRGGFVVAIVCLPLYLTIHISLVKSEAFVHFLPLPYHAVSVSTLVKSVSCGK